MPTLYEISNEIAAIVATSEDDSIAEDIEARLNALDMAFEMKVANILKYRQSLLSDAEGLKAEQDRLKQREDSLRRRAEWLKTYIFTNMQALGIGKTSTPEFTATVAKAPHKAVLEGDEIPFEYRREKTTIEFDKSKAVEDFKAGKPLPPQVQVLQSTYLKIS